MTLSITKLADSSSISVSNGVWKQVASLQPLLPPGMRVEVVTDLATYTLQAFNTIQRTLDWYRSAAGSPQRR